MSVNLSRLFALICISIGVATIVRSYKLSRRTNSLLINESPSTVESERRAEDRMNEAKAHWRQSPIGRQFEAMRKAVAQAP